MWIWWKKRHELFSSLIFRNLPGLNALYHILQPSSEMLSFLKTKTKQKTPPAAANLTVDSIQDSIHKRLTLPTTVDRLTVQREIKSSLQGEVPLFFSNGDCAFMSGHLIFSIYLVY